MLGLRTSYEHHAAFVPSFSSVTLPCLKELTLSLSASSADTQFGALFLQESVDSLSCNVIGDGTGDHDVDNIGWFYTQIARRCHGIKRFRLEVKSPSLHNRTEPHFLDLIRGLRGLEVIVFPLYVTTPQVLCALSANTSLECIMDDGIRNDHSENSLPHYTGGLHSSVLNPGFFDAFPASPESFSKLTHLSLSGFTRNILAIVDRSGVGNLLCLHIAFLDFPDRDQFRVLTCAISTRSPDIDFLRIEMAPEVQIEEARRAAFNTTWRLTWQDIRPLTLCKKLMSIAILWPHVPLVTDEAMKEAAQSWPSLTELCLMYEEATTGQPDETCATTLKSLASFAICCPNLEYLRIPIRLTLPEDRVFVERVRTTWNTRDHKIDMHLALGLPLPPPEDLARIATFLNGIITGESILTFTSVCCILPAVHSELDKTLQDSWRNRLTSILEWLYNNFNEAHGFKTGIRIVV